MSSQRPNQSLEPTAARLSGLRESRTTFEPLLYRRLWLSFHPLGAIEPMSTTPTDRALRKARAIFTKAFDARGSLLFKSSSTAAMMETIGTAFARRMNREKAADVGFHLGDWASDAALVLALHMFPKKFSPEEVRHVTDYLAAGLPYHCAGLAAHFGYEGLARSGIREVKPPKHLTRRSSERRHRATVAVDASRGRRR